MTSNRAERAAERRASWEAEVVPLGTPKPRLYASLSPYERLARLAQLNRRAWMASGRAEPAPLPCPQWPGETFEIEHA